MKPPSRRICFFFVLGHLGFRCSLGAKASFPSDQIPETVAQDLLNALADHFATRIPQTSRSLQEEGGDPPCDEVVDTWTREQVLEEVEAFLSAAGASTSSFVLPLIEYGIQIRKVCAACSDYDDLSSTSFCSSEDYGSNVTMSGLVVLPLTNSSESPVLVTGNHVVSIYGRGTRVATEPSSEWTSTVSTSSSPEPLFMAMVTAITGSVAVLPDFMGYGESLGSAYRSYIVKKSYQTSTLPLLYRVDEILREESSSARLSNAAVVSGYSEGGYAAVAITSALEEIGMQVLISHVGGAPIAISSTQLLRTTARVDNQSFPEENYYYLCLLGSAYSSTNPDVLNFEEQSDMLDALYRSPTVLLTNSANATQAALNTFIYDLPGENPSTILNPIFVNWTRAAVALNETNPCNSSNPAVSDIAPKELCAALVENDLTQTVLSARSPIRLCHSPDDVLVDFGNVPNTSLNENLDLSLASGSHVEAAFVCLTDAVLWYLGPDFVNFDPETAPAFVGTSAVETPGGGDGEGEPPGGSPTAAPTESTSFGPPSPWSSWARNSLLTGLAAHLLLSL